MKKIKSIKQLKNEKKKIKEDLNNLEKKIKVNWNELKEALRPTNMATDAFGSILKRNTETASKKDSILKNTMAYGISLMANKMAAKAENKINRIFKK
jgi:phage shock protein A